MPSRCIVAIDLGTSRSAWAFSFEGQAEGAVIVRVPEGCQLAGAGNKTETAVLLSKDSYEVLAFGEAARERFMKESEDIEDVDVDPGAEVGSRPLHAYSNRHEGSEGHLEAQADSSATSMLFRWFKMELCRKGNFKKVTDPVATAEGGQTVPLLPVMAAVLRHFKEDAVAYLSSLDEELGEFEQDITWSVTIPAIYDDFARRFMRVAAHEAGLIENVDSPRLRLCLEPEAACLAVSVKEAPELSQPGTQTMILDCGGGTVDITTHEVLSLSPLRLKELLPPTGGPWGSTYVDSDFMSWFRTFIGDEAYTKIRRTSSFYTVLTKWEEQKKRFSGGDDEGIRLPMAGFVDSLDFDADKLKELCVAHNERNSEVPELHISSKKFSLKLSSGLVRSFFASTVDKISTCLDGLKSNPSLTNLKFVFLVGGFSASPLVQAAAKASLDGDGCRVVAALRPDEAIVNGAVLYASNTKVFKTRKARQTYGVACMIPYDSNNPGHVSRRSKFPYFGEDGVERINAFSTHLNIGDDIPEDGVCPKQRYFPLTKAQDAVDIRILASHKEDIQFPDKGITFPMGEVTIPLDMSVDKDDRGVDVEFAFGGTEFSVNCFAATTGNEVGNVQIEIVQEVVQGG